MIRISAKDYFRIVAMSWLMAGAAVVVAQEAKLDWKKPAALKAGDTIALVAPAGPVGKALLEGYAKDLERAGFRVKIPEGLGGREHGYLAGTDAQRADELNAMIRDPEVRAIFAVRGGYGVTRILDRVDYAALRADPKIVTGYSDITGLHLAIARHARVVSFHAPMPTSPMLRSVDPGQTFGTLSFRRALLGDAYSRGEPGYAVAVPDDARPVKLVGGKARGRLLGGNLSLIAATMGTPYAIEPEGIILFVEDVHEAPYRVDRMLTQLRLAGVLDKVAGVVAGSFTSDDPGDRADLDRVVREAFGGMKVPVVLGFPVGHTPLNATLPEGGLVELDGDAATLRLVENPVRTD